jgi:hypothetical protein
MVGLQRGEKLPFLLDTGSAATCLDKSLEPRLGKRLGPVTAVNFGVEHGANLYEAPPLYLGTTPLTMIGPSVVTFDFKRAPPRIDRLYVGILGMDVLLNYCLQLDFTSHEIRFLAKDQVDGSSCGKPFQLTDVGDGCVSIGENLVGGKEPGSLIDTGCRWDGWLTPACFRQWTNQPALGARPRMGFHYGMLGGETYPEIELTEQPPVGDDLHIKLNGIGLGFLARHLVTFDFPNRTMYLKRTSAASR